MLALALALARARAPRAGSPAVAGSGIRVFPRARMRAPRSEGDIEAHYPML